MDTFLDYLIWLFPNPQVDLLYIAGILLLLMFLGALRDACRRSNRPREKLQHVGKGLPDIEFNGVVIHPVRKTDKQLEVRWTIQKTAEG